MVKITITRIRKRQLTVLIDVLGLPDNYAIIIIWGEGGGARRGVPQVAVCGLCD